MSLSVIAIFCEDIRPEVAGGESIIGAMSDVVIVPAVPPVAFPKLGIYAKVQFTPDDIPQTASLSVRGPDGGLITKNDVDLSTIETAAESFEGRSVSGFKAIMMLGGIMLAEDGMFTVTLETDRHHIIAGVLEVRFQPPIE